MLNLEETVKQESLRLGISLNEVRRKRNNENPRKEMLRLHNGGYYLNGFGDKVQVRLLPIEDQIPKGTKHIYICDENFQRYTEYGIYDSVNGPLVKFNLMIEV